MSTWMKAVLVSALVIGILAMAVGVMEVLYRRSPEGLRDSIANDPSSVDNIVRLGREQREREDEKTRSMLRAIERQSESYRRVTEEGR